MMPAPALTLYFDGRCPFCVTEIGRLRGWDTAGRLAFIDIAEPGFDPAPLGVDMAALNRELHAATPGGALLVGIDSMLAAYTLVGRGRLVWPLRIRRLRPGLAALYRWFARNRYRFSRLLGYRLQAPLAACDGATCAAKGPFMK